jgi:flagellar protein FlaJ
MAVPRRLADPYFLAALAVAVAIVAYFREPTYAPLLLIPAAVGLVRIGLPLLRSKLRVSAVDLDLLFLLLHMYSVSTGKPPRKRLFQLNCIVGDYGEYGRALNRIAGLAVDWGYGFVAATRYVAREVRNRALSDFLLRFSEVLRTGEDPTLFLETEFAAARRNYQSQYYRTVDILRIVLGLHTTVMSAAAFILTVMSVLLMFVGGDVSVYFVTFVSSTTLVAMFTAVIYVAVPKEWITPRARPKPARIYRGYNIALAVSLPLAAVLGYLAYRELGGAEWSLMAVGGVMLVPGLAARSIESRVKKLESFYTIFVRSLGMTYAIIPNYQKAFSSLLMSDFGPLMGPLSRAYSRVSNGIDPRIAWRYFIYDTWSDLIARSTNVFADTVDAGGSTRLAGTLLSDLCTRMSDLRSLRERVARTFEVTTYMMQALVSAIAVAIINIVRLFSDYVRVLAIGVGTVAFYELPMMALTPETVAIMTNITMVFLALLTVMNAIAIKVACGGIPEAFWQQVSILLVVTSGAVVGMRFMVEAIFGSLLVPPALVPG